MYTVTLENILIDSTKLPDELFDVGTVDVEFEVSVYGKYYPATQDEPAEYPELGDYKNIKIVAAFDQGGEELYCLTPEQSELIITLIDFADYEDEIWAEIEKQRKEDSLGDVDYYSDDFDDIF